ncbi:phosphoserine phosphatase activity [Suhomyces tanzawaensis NRRL Y-17324]|uniref:phosphoserine phosphatase n=1 Tax=Suhomyces tanzawaensis NRRL Y-17324 TaxID=984487 RepID=A0A1E4SFS1_9ASCO|nr:phosphoserine phosphatase activity [Suhomyces tanzawaensis NRRL Y-17324]ODV78369.1 phosphoserine phosphatase activity [Suhomyces tanzawaensis NRRL Y-17324]
MSEYVITVIAHGPALSVELVDSFESEFISRIGSFTSKKLSPRAIDYYVNPQDPQEAADSIKRDLLTKSPKYDVIFQRSDARKDKKLFIFDMDSTLIYQEVIELIAAYANIEDKVAEITERAMNGELDFNESLEQRVLLLKGIDASTIWEELKHKIKITNGAKELCKALSKLGVVMGVCSGGFIPLAEYVKGELGLHYAYANQLGVDSNQALDGTTFGPIVNGDKKAELLLEIASNHGIDPAKAVAVGDGANDLKMMGVAGFGVAWNAKPNVQKQAPCCLNSDSLQDILYIMGYDDEEISRLISE